MIEVSDLAKFYGSRQVLHDLTFAVGTGRVCGFLGPNGSGKSTTMDILSGLLGPSSGSVRVCGFDVVKNPRDVKAIVGYLPDNPPLYKEMAVSDFIGFVARLRGIKGHQRKMVVQNVMEQCDVTDVSKRLIGHLSKGYRQRVALCSALVHSPKVLVLDEPTEGLDPSQIVLIRNLIKKLAQDRTVILSSHILSEVQATCDDVVIINHGHIATAMPLDKTGPQHSSYIFSFAGKAEQALKWFQQRTFVASAELCAHQDNAVLVHFGKKFWNDGENVKEDLARVSSELVHANFPLMGMVERKEGLDKIFFDVVRSQPNVSLQK